MDAKLAGDKERELALARGLVEAEPQSASLREALGLLLVNRGPEHHEEGEKVLRAAIRLDPRSPRSHYALGRISDKRADRLREQVKEARARDDDKEAIRELVQEERLQVRRALRQYRTCLEFEAHFPDAIEQLVRLLSDEAERSARAGEVDEARAGLEEAAALLERWWSFTPEGDATRVQIEHNRGVVARRLEALGSPK
jgi:tetratricopeptide (TPR) repeat protein